MPRYDFRTTRLYIDAPLEDGASIALDASQANYLGNVLRMKDGDAVLAFNGRDGEWRATLASAALASEASGQRGHSKMRAPDTRPEPGSSARAQQPGMPVVGFLDFGSAAERTQQLAAFRKGLAEAGYQEGQNVALEFGWAEGQYGSPSWQPISCGVG